jgi:Flp pilus assembly protein TadD
VVANTKVGHLFPSGTLDLNEPWLEFIVSDSNGKPILASGLMSEDRRLDPTAHRFDVVLLSKESNLIDIHNVEHFHSELYNNAIPLGQSDVIRFDFQVPELPSGEKLKLSARVRFRKFNQQYIEFVYGKNAPVFPIVEVCRDEVDVVVGEINPSAWEPILPTDKTAAEALARRMRNLGISHLRQRDTLNALWAFQQAAKITPNDPDLYIDMARCYLQTGNYSDDLEEVLRKADEVRPGFHKTGFFFGKLMAARGKFDKAIRAYDSILALFPDDRVVVNSKGIALYKSQKYQEAIDVFAHTLAIDPENVEAHNYCFLSHRNLGNKEQASFHEYSYLRYQPQESEKSIHELYRRRNPHADREANLQHVHPLHPPSEIQRLVDEGETYRYPHSDVQPKKVTEAKAPIPTGLAN